MSNILSILNCNLKIKISFLIIFFSGLGLRFFYFPYELPLVADGMDYFTYATEIVSLGHLPTEWTPINNGWSIFVSFWFSILNLEYSLGYMQLQRILSIILSSLITIPVYFLCKRFFDEKISLVGAALFTFEPRILINSLLGITEPLFILLGISSLITFLKYDKKYTIISFTLASFCTIIRSEGLFLFFILTILFIVKYKFSKEIIKTFLPCVGIFLLILMPIMSYRIEVTGYDGIFQRASGETVRILSNSNYQVTNEIVAGLELFIKYLGWIMIPSFLVFVPLGIIQFLRKRTKETNFIIIFLIVSSIPILYAYFSQALDTRYFYVLYPIFCLLSLFAVETYLVKLPRKNLMLSLMIIGILITSVGFYEYEKIDYEKEQELNKIAKIISNKELGLNFHPTFSRYIYANELPTTWPFVINDVQFKTKIIPTSNFENLESFIISSRTDLTHLIIDDNPNLPNFLQKVYNNEEKYEYLNEVYNSKDENFKHQMKLFKIDFQKLDSKK